VIIAIDFDGTLCDFDFPKIGKPKYDVINKVREAQEKGHQTILWTCRNGKSLEEVLEWCSWIGLNFTEVNRDVRQVREEWQGDIGRKVVANLYVDDRSPGSIEYFLNIKL